MSDIKLFQFSADDAHPLPSHTAPLERELHNLMQKHMECFLGIRFVASEYGTGKIHGGRIDSLGLDENNCPVILEYKRHKNENVINQGLYYLDWLLDHRAEFKLLVLDRFGREIADAIEWSGTRVLCIAGDFTKFDEHAVAQIQLAAMPDEQRILYEELCSFIFSLGDDINVKELQLYVAFTRLKNFVCLCPMHGWFKLWLHLDPDNVTLERNFSRNVRDKVHWGTGDLELSLRTMDDLTKAKPLIERAYQES